MTKVEVGGEEYFCRFIVIRQDNGLELSHGANISDVEIMKSSLEKSRATLREKKGLQLIRESSDTKLLNFFTTATLGIKVSPQHKYDTLFKDGEIKDTYLTYREGLDLDYLNFIKKDQMGTAALMVRDAFKAKFPNTKVVDESGEPLVVYHGTQWDPYAEKVGDAVFKSGWFTGLQKRAEGFGKPVRAFLNIKNPIQVSEIDGEFPPLPDGFDINSPETWGEHDGFISYTDYPEEPTLGELAKRRIKMLHPNNYEEALANALSSRPRGRQVFSAIPRYPNQIISAEPVTYDDNGNVIPLSERFNPEKDDIRFSFVGATGLLKSAKTDEEKQAIKDNLNAAKVALCKPDLTLEDKRKIKLATGWELGPDGKVRHEIQDFKLRGAGAATFVRPWNGDGSFEQKTLGEILREDEEIFTLYPELRDIKVSVERLPEKAYAQFSARDNKITLSPGIMKDVKGRSNAMRIGNTAYSALLHEVQHAIQRQEGWARGGNTFNVGEGAENLNPDEYKKQAVLGLQLESMLIFLWMARNNKSRHHS